MKSQDEASLKAVFDEKSANGPLYAALQKGGDLMPHGDGGLLKWKCLVFVAVHNKKRVSKAEFELFMKSGAQPRTFPSADSTNVIGLRPGVCGAYAPASSVPWNNHPIAKITDADQIVNAWTTLSSWSMSMGLWRAYSAFTIVSLHQWNTLQIHQPWKIFNATLIGEADNAKRLQAALFGTIGDDNLLHQNGQSKDVIDLGKLSVTHKVSLTFEAFHKACRLYNGSTNWGKIRSISDKDAAKNDVSQQWTFILTKGGVSSFVSLCDGLLSSE